jgi:hypothetical protein
MGLRIANWFSNWPFAKQPTKATDVLLIAIRQALVDLKFRPMPHFVRMGPSDAVRSILGHHYASSLDQWPSESEAKIGTIQSPLP